MVLDTNLERISSLVPVACCTLLWKVLYTPTTSMSQDGGHAQTMAILSSTNEFTSASCRCASLKPATPYSVSTFPVSAGQSCQINTRIFYHDVIHATVPECVQVPYLTELIMSDSRCPSHPVVQNFRFPEDFSSFFPLESSSLPQLPHYYWRISLLVCVRGVKAGLINSNRLSLGLELY